MTETFRGRPLCAWSTPPDGHGLLLTLLAGNLTGGSQKVKGLRLRLFGVMSGTGMLRLRLAS